MRRVFLVIAGCALLSGSALAQSSSSSPESYDRSDRGGWRQDRDGDDTRGGRNDEGRRGGNQGDRMDRDGGGERNMRRGGGRGAQFRIKSGDTQIAVRCDGREIMRACVEAVTTLMEKSRAAVISTPSTVPSNPAPGTSAPR